MDSSFLLAMPFALGATVSGLAGLALLVRSAKASPKGTRHLPVIYGGLLLLPSLWLSVYTLPAIWEILLVIFGSSGPGS